VAASTDFVGPFEPICRRAASSLAASSEFVWLNLTGEIWP
jgi:hypothetical protein